MFSLHDIWTDHLMILTDLEPDDLIALLLIKDKLAQAKSIMFVVGEGNAMLKAARMSVYVEMLELSNCSVIRGCSSDKEFEADGLELFSPEYIAHVRSRKDEYKVDFTKILTFLKEKKPFVLSLKPPRELIHLWKEDPTVFHGIVMAGYMSFNIRCLFQQHSHELVAEFLHSFQRVFFYETFLATGEKNSVDTVRSLPRCVKKQIQLWNRHIQQECVETLNNCNLSAVVRERNLKIIQNIEACPNQFVNADSGLVLSLLLNVQDQIVGKVKFHETNHYSMVNPTETGNIVFFCPEKEQDKNALWNKQLAFLQHFQFE
ncbi:MAG: hypothetical protein Sylvanvirus1_98 [Sylvanvirus sp.]|uniref:Uncharacterized protein n=1 Tax=Sylvanvirus sp. TaxID=2487774 RepID=A0A3G5AH24_9VIRU|nr:MAG: hypothetical protein Sylvanvirus1_98 [Sylvanvirus sp.]